MKNLLILLCLLCVASGIAIFSTVCNDGITKHNISNQEEILDLDYDIAVYYASKLNPGESQVLEMDLVDHIYTVTVNYDGTSYSVTFDDEYNVSLKTMEFEAVKLVVTNYFYLMALNL